MKIRLELDNRVVVQRLTGGAAQLKANLPPTIRSRSLGEYITYLIRRPPIIGVGVGVG